MFVANLATLVLSNIPALTAVMFQESAGIGWDPLSIWRQMGVLAKIVVVVLFIMSGWSIGIMIDRAMAYSAARKQSRMFAPAVAGGISEALATTAIGLFVAIPAVWMFNYFTNRVEAFDVEMDNSSSELIDYFLKQRNLVRK